MRKPRVITNYKKVRQADLGTVAQTVHDMMTGNATFPTPPITMAAFLLLVKDYVLKLATALHGTPVQTTAKNVAKTALLDAMTKNAVYVNATADGNEGELQSSGYFLAKTPQPKGPLAVPSLFRVNASPEPGRAIVEFMGLPGSTYLVRLTPDIRTDRSLWQTAIDTRRNFIIEGLTSGSRYTFIGAYKGASNVLNFTQPVEVVIQ